MCWICLSWNREVTGGRGRKTYDTPEKRRCAKPLWRKQKQRISYSYKYPWVPAGQAPPQHSNAISFLFYCFWRVVLASSPCRRYKATWTPSGNAISEKNDGTPTRYCDASGGLALFLLKSKGDLLVTNVSWNRGDTWLCNSVMSDYERQSKDPCRFKQPLTV